MFRNRRTALLASAAVLSGAMSMTACQGTNSCSNSGAAQGSLPVAPPAAPPAAAAIGGHAGGSAEAGGGAGGTEPAGKDSAGKNSGGRGATAPGGGGGDNGSVGKCRTDDLRATAQDATTDAEAAGHGTVPEELVGLHGAV